MPERINKSQRKVDSTEIQGEGSFIVIRTPTLGDVRILWDRGIDEPSKEFSYEMLKLLVIEWNWVGDDGAPLPNPKDHPEAIENLPIHELVFLLEAAGLRGLAEKAKN